MASLSLYLPVSAPLSLLSGGTYVSPLWFLRFVTSGFGSLPCSECSHVLVVCWLRCDFPTRVQVRNQPPESGKFLTVPSLTSSAHGLASSVPAVSGSVLVLPGWACSRERQSPSLTSVLSKLPLGIFIVIYTFLRSGLRTRIFFKTTMKRESWKNS